MMASSSSSQPSRNNGQSNNNNIGDDAEQEQQLNNVFQLLTARASGAANITDDLVEAAVQQLFHQNNNNNNNNDNNSPSKNDADEEENRKMSAPHLDPTLLKTERTTSSSSTNIEELSRPPSASTSAAASNNSSRRYPTRTSKRTASAEASAAQAERKPAPFSSSSSPMKPVREDEEDYDDDDTKDNNDSKKKPSSSCNKRRRRNDVIDETSDTVAASTASSASASANVIIKHDYSSTPFGQQGAHMLTNFGDGPLPLPKTVSAVLQGARLLLQTAIRDARCVRRQQQEQFVAAKRAATSTKQRPIRGAAGAADDDNGNGEGKNRTGRIKKCNMPVQERVEQPSAEMMFRATASSSAMTGGTTKYNTRVVDPLAYSPSCGFGVQELDALFPEEMNAFRRWSEMESSANPNNNNNVDDVKSNNGQDGNDDDEEEDNKEVNTDTAVIGGHFIERLAQFDVRTDRMRKEWYMVFADLRQGSFLPRRLGGVNSSDRDWESKQGPKRRGRCKDGTWSHMPAVTVRFLHWIGFEPQSSLPPPNEDTAQALAYLGHNFVGRIVEVAIRLKKPNSEIIELTGGEQLMESDIERAMEDAEIKPAPLYSTADGNGSDSINTLVGTAMPQLYFGPGFEDRLEMELEEMLGTAVVSDQEKMIRKNEQELFSRLAAVPPPIDGIASLLDKEASATAQSDENGQSSGANTGDSQTPEKKACGNPSKRKR